MNVSGMTKHQYVLNKEIVLKFNQKMNVKSISIKVFNVLG